MPRPNNAAAIAEHVKGLREAKAAFKRLPVVTRERMADATETTVRIIAGDAQRRVLASPSVRTKALYNAIGWVMNRKSGLGRAGVKNVTSTVSSGSFGTIGKGTVKVKGIVIPGKGGSALKSQGARVVKPSRYAHLVEKGTRKMPAEPFMGPSADAEKQNHIMRSRLAGREIERDMGAAGGRLL